MSEKHSDKKAMILAAGLGTRLGPVTRDTPKALVDFHGFALLEIVIRRLIQAGFDDMVVNVHHYADSIRRYLEEKENFGIHISLSEEQPQPLETGGAVKFALPMLEKAEGILVHNVDVLTDLPLDDFFNMAMKENIPAVLSVRERKATRYLLADERMLLCGWEDPRSGKRKVVRKPEGEIKRYGFSGIQVIRKRAFNMMPVKNIFSLTEFYLNLARNDRVKLVPYLQGFWYDIGKPVTLRRAEKKITPDILSRLTGKQYSRK
ncbi:MAG: NTP transferase domain-containing protein [Chlorobi bacterium]|nr:NTP transferase domain-containing protein [Chlorobiota bacterium]